MLLATSRKAMLRPTTVALFGGGSSSNGGPNFHEMFAQARNQHNAQMAQQQASQGGMFNPFGGGGAMNPFAAGGTGMMPTTMPTGLRGDEFIDVNQLHMMRERMNQAFTPEMRDAVHNTLKGMGEGKMPGGMGMMAFGVGENENGKRVAKGAKVFVDMDGNVTKEYKEHQIDPDDMLPKQGAGGDTYNYDDATEVKFEEGNASKGTAAETISEMEVEFEPADSSSRKK